MKMSSKELVEEILYDFLWEVVGNKTEEVDNLPELLKETNYLDDKEEYISKTTKCEINESDEFIINKITEDSSSIVVDCEMIFIMNSFVEKEAVWRITGTTIAQIKIPNVDGHNWMLIKNVFFKQDLLKHKDVVTFNDIHFDWVECDCIL